MANECITKAYANQIANHVFGGTTYTPVTTWYVGLSTTAIQTDGSGYTEPSSVNVSGYARKSYTNASGFTIADGEAKNTNEIRFDEMTHSLTTNPEITHWFLCEESSGTPTILLHGALDNSRILQSGTTIYFKANELKVTLQ